MEINNEFTATSSGVQYAMAKIRTYTHDDLMRDDTSKKPDLKSFTEGRVFRIPKWVGDDVPEREIQKDCIKYLRSHGIPTLRVEAGAVIRKTGPGTGIATASQAVGWPDVVCCMPPVGRLLGLEFKKPGGTIKSSQIQILLAINRAGGRAGIITSFSGLMEFLNKLGEKHSIEGVGVW